MKVTHKGLANLLWPLAASVFTVLVVPFLIAQYPDFFNHNVWLLPASVVVTVLLFLAPFLLHRWAITAFKWGASIRRVGIPLVGIVIIALLAGLGFCAHLLLIYHIQHLEKVSAPVRPLAPAAQPPTELKVTLKELEEKDRQARPHRTALFKEATPNEDLSHLSHDQLNIYAMRNARVLAERSYAWRNFYFTLDTAIRDFSDPRHNVKVPSEEEIKAYTAQRLKQKNEWADKSRTETRSAMKRVCGLQAQIFDRGLDPIEKKDVLPSARFTELCKSIETAEYSDLDVALFSDYITQVAAKSEISIKP